MFRIGLISDTHGLLRDEATDFLRGCDHIIHGGDIGHAGILEELANLAPVTAVLGNNDHGPWAAHLAETELVELGGIRIYAIHDLAVIAIDPVAANVRVVVSGHSHKPSVEERNGVLYINPGSAGPRRFKLPISIGEIVISNGGVVARTVALDTPAPKDGKGGK